MPFTPQTPQTQSVNVTTAQDREIDTFDIMRYDMRFDPNDESATYVMVTWVGGYMNEGSFVEAHRAIVRLEGPSFIDAISADVDSSESIYGNVKNALWTYMQAEGIVPSGVII